MRKTLSQFVAAALLIGLVAAAAPAAEAQAKKKIVFICGTPSHGFAAHEHNAGSLLLAKCLNETMGDKIETIVLTSKTKDGKNVSGWPDDTSVLEGASAIIMYCDGGAGHLAMPHLKELDALAAKGVGIGAIHYGVEVPKGEAGDYFTKWIGGYFETFWSVNPHWKAEVTSLPKHPVANGVHPFSTNDEWYYHMRFRPNMEGVTPIIAAIPPDKTREGKDDAHGGNPTVRDGVGKSLPEVTVWVAENKDTTNRGFGCTGGHVHWNWAQDDFRKTILNAIVWTAKMEVPANGVESKRPTIEDLLAHQDEPVPANFNRADVEKLIAEMNLPRNADSAK